MQSTDKTEPIPCTSPIPILKDAIKNRRPISGITNLSSHLKEHFDEILDHYILQRTEFGTKMFPGIENAKRDTLSKEQINRNEISGIEGWYEALQCGTLITGTGNGVFDEHNVRSDEHPSSARMIANYVGITQHPVYGKIFAHLLNYVDYEDRNGDNINDMFAHPRLDTQLKIAAQSLLPASYIKMRWNDIADDDIAGQEKLINWVYEMLDGYVESRTNFYLHAKKAYEESEKQFYPLPLPEIDGKQPILLVLKTDNTLASRYAAYSFKGRGGQKLSVMLIINSKNQFCILPYNGCKDRMTEVMKIIQIKVLHHREIRSAKWEELGQEGSIWGAEEIHFQADAGRIMNGSLRETDIPGIVGKIISEEEIIWSICTGLGYYFHGKFSTECKQDTCARSRCPFYQFGLQRCHDVRSSAKNTVGTIAIKKQETTTNEQLA